MVVLICKFPSYVWEQPPFMEYLPSSETFSAIYMFVAGSIATMRSNCKVSLHMVSLLKCFTVGLPAV